MNKLVEAITNYRKTLQDFANNGGIDCKIAYDNAEAALDAVLAEHRAEPSADMVERIKGAVHPYVAPWMDVDKCTLDVIAAMQGDNV